MLGAPVSSPTARNGPSTDADPELAGLAGRTMPPIVPREGPACFEAMRQAVEELQAGEQRNREVRECIGKKASSVHEQFTPPRADGR